MRIKTFALLCGVLLTACLAPVRGRLDISPGFSACAYRTYAWTEPEDKTRLQVLSEAKLREALEKEIREELAKAGLQPVPAGQTADAILHYILMGEERAATQAPQDVHMASDYKMARVTLSLLDAKAQTPLWNAAVAVVAGDIQTQNLTNFRKGLQQALRSYPACPAKEN